MRRSATLEYELGIYQLAQRTWQIFLRQTRNRSDQLIGEYPTNCRANLCHVLPGGQSIQSGEKRGVQRRGNGQWRQRPDQLVSVGSLAEQVALQYGLRQLLDEQRHAVGVHHDLIQHLGWQGFAMGYASNQRLSLGAVEAVERHIHHMTKVGPGSLELRARRSEQQQSDAVSLLDDSRKQFQRGRIDPMQVLEEQQHWLASAQLMQPRSKR